MKTIRTLILSFCLSLVVIGTAMAQLNVSPIFGSDMVLQRGTTVPVFGTANPGATVSVQFLSQNKSAVADGSGNWQVDLSSMSANSSLNTLTVSSGGDVVTLTGVQVGEVWVCSGQSNMGWSLEKADNSAATIADAGNHNIRLFRMTAGNGPATTTWQVSNSSTVGSFSAVGYWMGLELSQWFGNVPIGLVQATHDGTAISAWQHTNGGTGEDYDAMVKSIQPFAVQGVAWYQGESNGGSSNYDVLLRDMIQEWRADWGQSSLPFGIIQLAYRSGWNSARNAQLIVADTEPECFLVVIRDLPGGSLHPTTKQPVGLRTAIGARGLVYGDNITYSGPIRDIENSFVTGNTVVLNWKHVGNGLFTDDGLDPGDFKVAGATGQFKSATAVIVGNTIQVSSSMVSDPARVQYSYSGVGNLYNMVSIPTAGGSVIVDRLKASEFEFTIGAGGGNVAPTASFSYSATNLSVSFDGSASSDSDGTVTGYSWDFGDGNTATGATSSHTYAAAGSYTVELTVTDDGGATGTQSQVVSVSDGSGGGSSMHVQALITYSQSAGQGNKNGVAQVTIHDDQENPVAGATVSGTFSGTFSESASGQTGSDGVVTFVTSGTAKGGVVVDFCVDNVTGALTYNPAQNDITCTGGGARTSPEAGTAAQSNAALQVFPNPSPDGKFSILLPKGRHLNGEVSISILDLQGRLVHQSTQKNVGSMLSVDTPMQQGLYLLRLKHPDLNFESRLLIK